MGVLTDYRCERCVAVPPPTHAPCPACGAPARRLFSPPALGRGRSSGSELSSGPHGNDASQPTSRARNPMPPCLVHPDVPALCHLDPRGARAWVARAQGDHRTLERELAFQEARQGEAAGSGAAPGSAHHHHHAHHDDGHHDDGHGGAVDGGAHRGAHGGGHGEAGRSQGPGAPSEASRR